MVYCFIVPWFLMVPEWDLPNKLQSQNNTLEISVKSAKISKYSYLIFAYCCNKQIKKVSEMVWQLKISIFSNLKQIKIQAFQAISNAKIS